MDTCLFFYFNFKIHPELTSMKVVKRFFDSNRQHFVEGGRFASLYALFEAIETIFFAPDTVTRTSPNVRDSLDVKRFMTLVIVALLPHYAFGVYNVGYQSHLASGVSTSLLPVILTGLSAVVPMVIVTYVVGLAWEVLFAAVRKHEISEGLFVSCALFPLTLPPTIPLWQVALGISFGVVIGKEIFGGTGRNFLNPALTARAFLYFAYPAQSSGDAIWTLLRDGRSAPVDTFTGATPLSLAASTGSDQTVAGQLAEAGFSNGDLFLGLYPGSIGGTSTLLALAGAAFLVILGIANYRIIVGGMLGVVLTGGMINLLAGPQAAAFLHLNPLHHLTIGGVMFGLAYMATDPVSATHMPGAKWVFGFMIGMLTVVIRVFNPAFPEGVGLAIIFMNVFAPLLDHLEVQLRLRRRIPNI